MDYDPNAKCPRFHAFLGRFQPNHTIQTFLQTYHGYGLTGLTGEQCLIFNYGLGANGKSTFVDILAQIMGDYAKTLGFESLVGEGIRRGDQATPDLARLPGARLVRVSEPEGAVRLKEGLIKSLTGGEPMSVRHLNKGFFEFKPQNLPQKGIAKIEGRIRQYVNVRLHDVPTTANRPNDDSSDDDEVPF
ncbi:hypothetical protein AB8B24_27045 [Tardiphaga sp. 866_E4_N2_3]|uniref:hypothetical protein n=1 Tax=Tardiphaga sp. 866_E4_N2_3 TaxID=3240768 RepID=UPI003F247A1C